MTNCAHTLERGHHPFSASSLGALAVSPGFEPDRNRDQAAAKRGTRLHSLVPLPVEQDPPDLSDEDRAALQWVRKIRKRFLNRPGLIQEEVYFPTDDFVIRDAAGQLWGGLSGGYADFVWVGVPWAIILDYKFGWWPVPPAKVNLQGWVYALGVFHRYPHVKRVMVAFLQPMGRRVSVARFHRDDVPRLRQQIALVIARAAYIRQTQDLQRCSPSVYCQWCAHAGRCPRLWTLTREFAVKFLQTDIPDVPLETVLQNADLAGRVLEIVALIARHLDGLRKTITEHAIDSEGAWLPTGYRLVTRQQYRWVQGKDPEQYLSALFPPDVLKAARTYDLAALLEAAAAAAPRGEKARVREALKDALLAEGFLEPGSPVVYLAHT